MDNNIENFLTALANKSDLIKFITDLPEAATGILCFSVPSDELSDDGEELELLKYRSYGNMTKGDAFLMCQEAQDMIRGLL